MSEGVGGTMTEVSPGQVIDGRYRVVAALGEGAMCRVLRAEQLGLGRQVALKIPKPVVVESPAGLARFLREAKAAARLVHPNVVEIYEVGETPSLPYLAMELVEGGDLGDGFDANWPLERSLPVLAGVAQALGCAGAARVVHRDLKPDNILVTADGQAKVADWGLALLVDGSTRLTATGFTVGTMVYMAPEQFSSGEVGSAADWYALGLVVYEAVMVGGGFPRRGRLEHLMGHLYEDLVPVECVVPDVAPELARLVGRLLVRNAAGRLTDADEVAGCLEKASAAQTTARRGQGIRRCHPPGPQGVPEVPAPRGLFRQLPMVALALVVFVAVALAWEAWTLTGTEAVTDLSAGGIVLREARLMAPSRLELRIEGGTPGDVVSVAVGPLDGSTAPVLVAPLSTARGVSLRVRALELDLAEPVIQQARVVVRDEGGRVVGTTTVSGQSFLDAFLAPVRQLQGERLSRTLQALVEMRNEVPGGSRARVDPGEATERLGVLLARAGLTPSWEREARCILPLIVSAGAPVRLLGELMPLRMIEVLVADVPGCEQPWPLVAALLGHAVVPEGGGDARPGTRVLVDVDVMPRVPRPSDPATIVPIPRWLLEQAELERTLALRRFSIDSNVLSDQFNLAWSTATSETVVEFSLGRAQIPVSLKGVVLQLGFQSFYREGYLELDLNRLGGAVVLNGSPRDPEVVRFQSLALPVEAEWLLPGLNRLRLTARCMPGLRPAGPMGLRSVRLLVSER